MKRARVIVLCLISVLLVISTVFLFFKFVPMDVSGAERSGILFLDETWSGTVYVTGDLIVPPWATLTIRPGTKVLVRANSDERSEGGEHIVDELTYNDPSSTVNYTRTHSAILIPGKLIAVGTPEERIVFTSDAENPSHTDWEGITFEPGSSGEMKYCVVEWAHTGPALHGTNNVNVTHCEIRHTFWGGLHAFQCSPVFEYNILDDIGHEAFDTHKASPVIRYNTISHARVGVVFNNHDLQTPLIFENNTIRDSSHIGLLQESCHALIKDNIFMGSNDTGGPWHYEGFTLSSQPHTLGLGLADNVKAEITGNKFINLEGPAITYQRIGPNMGIGHTTNEPEPFEIGEGPEEILIKDNYFGDSEDEQELREMQDSWDNVKIENNSFK